MLWCALQGLVIMGGKVITRGVDVEDKLSKGQSGIGFDPASLESMFNKGDQKAFLDANAPHPEESEAPVANDTTSDEDFSFSESDEPEEENIDITEDDSPAWMTTLSDTPSPVPENTEPDTFENDSADVPLESPVGVDDADVTDTSVSDLYPTEAVSTESDSPSPDAASSAADPFAGLFEDMSTQEPGFSSFPDEVVDPITPDPIPDDKVIRADIEPTVSTGNSEEAEDTEDADAKETTPVTEDPEPERKKPQRADKSDRKAPGFLDSITEKIKENPKKWGIIAAAVLVVLLVLGSLSMCGKDDEEESSPPPAAASTEDDTSEVTGSPTANDPVIPSNADASGQCGPRSTDANLMFNGDSSTAWECQTSQGLTYNLVTLSFDKPVVLSSARVVPGFNFTEPSGDNKWDQYRQVTSMVWRFSSKKDDQYEMRIDNPSPAGSEVKFPSIATQEITVIVTGSQDPTGDSGGIGSKENDTFAIGSMELFGHLA